MAKDKNTYLQTLPLTLLRRILHVSAGAHAQQDAERTLCPLAPPPAHALTRAADKEHRR